MEEQLKNAAEQAKSKVQELSAEAQEKFEGLKGETLISHNLNNKSSLHSTNNSLVLGRNF